MDAFVSPIAKFHVNLFENFIRYTLYNYHNIYLKNNNHKSLSILIIERTKHEKCKNFSCGKFLNVHLFIKKT